jgi:hypothetical protein
VRFLLKVGGGRADEVGMHTLTRTTTTTTHNDSRRGDVSALLFGEVMAAARDALRAGELDRARGLAEAGEILSGISVDVLLERLA